MFYVGPQDATSEDAELPGRIVAPPLCFYVPLPGKALPKIIHNRYDTSSGSGPVRKVIRGGDTYDVPVYVNPFDVPDDKE
eukprot:6671979-Alexandrium_andersonii.AAC.1